MRVIALAGFFFFGSLVVSAPAPVTPQSPSNVKDLAEGYTSVLLSLIDQIHKGYVRPVDRGELLFAALGGLYEDAQLPVPHRLRPECKQIADAAGSRAGEVDEGVPTEPAVNDI